MLTAEQQETIKKVLAPYQPRLVAVFGSRARGEAHAESDLDLLVDLGVEVDLLELIGIEQELSEQLGIQVDLVTNRAVDPKMRPFIMKDLITIDVAAA
jgi:uncharacterized protein